MTSSMRLSGSLLLLLSLLLPRLPHAAEPGPVGAAEVVTDEQTRLKSNVDALKSAPSQDAIERESESQEDPLEQRQKRAGGFAEQLRRELGRWSWDWYASARLHYRNNGSDWLFGDGGSRMGLHAEYRLTPSIRLLGTLEEGFNLADQLDALLKPGDQSGTGTAIFNRLGYVGLETPRLNITAGKNWSTYYQIASFTDRLVAYGGEGSQYANTGTDGGRTGTGRADRVLQARFMVNAIPDNWWFKPFRLNLQVQDGNSIPGVPGEKYGTSFGASAILHLRNEFILGIAYNQAPVDMNKTLLEAGIRGNEEAVLLGSRWFDDSWYVGTTLSRLLNHATTDTGRYFDAWGAEIYGKYQLRPRLWLTGGWNYLQPDSNRAGNFRIQYLVPGLLYEVRGPRKFVYLEYKSDNSRRSDGSLAEDIVTVGIRWDFWGGG